MYLIVLASYLDNGEQTINTKKMRKKTFLNSVMILLLLLMVQVSGYANISADSPSPLSEDETLHVWTSANLYPLVSSWANQYSAENETVTIKIASLSDQTIAESIGNGSIGFLTNDQLATLQHPSLWRLSVGRDVLVPVTNSSNPALDDYENTGISRNTLKELISQKKGKVFTTNLNSELSQIALFLDTEDKELTGIIPLSKEELINTLQQNSSAICFCHLSDILNKEQTEFIGDFALIPIDENNNGVIDNFENIYNNLQSFARGVWIGKYPHSLAYNIYSVATEHPSDPAAQAFMEWILSEGQASMPENGYASLLPGERKSKIASIYALPSTGINVPAASDKALGTFFILATILLVGFLATLAYRIFRSGPAADQEMSLSEQAEFSLSALKIPSGLFFNQSHTWAFMEKDGFVRIGIDDFLSQVTGPLTNIKLKESGERIKKGEPVFSIVQKGKQLDIFSPVTGTIVKSNTALLNNISDLNSDPYMDGWVYTIEPLHWLSEIGSFMMGKEYTSWINKEFIRLKDFLATCCQNKSHHLPVMVLQDGGEIKNHPLQDAGPLTWEEFQTKFIEQ